MTYSEKRYVVNVIRNEGINYGLLFYTDFKDNIKDEKFHKIRRKYVKSDNTNNYVGKAEALAQLIKLLNIDIFSLHE